MDVRVIPPTGTCDISTLGRRSAQWRRVEIWYVVVDGSVVLTGTPGTRHWLANPRARPVAVLHLRDPADDVPATALEVTDPGERRRIAEEAWRLKPWYADQPFTLEDWTDGSPMVRLTPSAGPPRTDDSNG